MNALDLKVYIWMFIGDLIREQNHTFSDVSLKFSDNVLGTLDVTDIFLSGFETITNNPNNIDVTEDEDNNNDLCIFVPAENFQFSMNYDADIGIDDEIPIYGDGEFSFTMTDIGLNLCMHINFNERYLDDVICQIQYRHSPVQFTGFWRNKEVSLILEGLLNIVNRFIAMWTAYEPERASCLVSPFVSYGLNGWFGTENNTFVFDPTCLERIFFDDVEHHEIDNMEEHILKKMVTIQGNYDNDNTLNAFSEENKSALLPLINYFSDIALRLL